MGARPVGILQGREEAVAGGGPVGADEVAREIETPRRAAEVLGADLVAARELMHDDATAALPVGVLDVERRTAEGGDAGIQAEEGAGLTVEFGEESGHAGLPFTHLLPQCG